MLSLSPLPAPSSKATLRVRRDGAEPAWLPLGAALLVGLVAAGCVTDTGEAPPTEAPVPVAHLADCIEDAPDRPCERLPSYDPAYWTAEQADRTDAYLDASALCLRALLRGDVVGRRGACADVYPAYVADARDNRRDLDGRLDEAEAGRAFGLAYSAVVAARSARTAEGMREDGRDKDAAPIE